MSVKTVMLCDGCEKEIQGSAPELIIVDRRYVLESDPQIHLIYDIHNSVCMPKLRKAMEERSDYSGFRLVSELTIEDMAPESTDASSDSSDGQPVEETQETKSKK